LNDSTNPSSTLVVSFESLRLCELMAETARYVKRSLKLDLKTMLEEAILVSPTVCTVCAIKGEDQIVWRSSQFMNGQGPFVALKSDLSKTAAAMMKFLLLGQSAADVLTTNVRLVEVRRGAFEPNPRIVSPVVLLTASSTEADNQIAAGDLRVSFPLSVGENHADLEIYRLTTDRGKLVWTTTGIAWESVLPGLITAKVITPGIFAVAAVPNARRVCPR
jgi:hypothetical protein